MWGRGIRHNEHHVVSKGTCQLQLVESIPADSAFPAKLLNQRGPPSGATSVVTNRSTQKGIGDRGEEDILEDRRAVRLLMAQSALYAFT